MLVKLNIIYNLKYTIIVPNPGLVYQLQKFESSYLDFGRLENCENRPVNSSKFRGRIRYHFCLSRIK